MLELKRKENIRPQAQEAVDGASQFMVGLLISRFTLAITKNSSWALMGYVRASFPHLWGISLGLGYGHAQDSEAIFYSYFTGDLSQDLTFLSIGGGFLRHASVILGTYSASGHYQGKIELASDCSSWQCYRRWTDMQASVHIYGNVLGFVYSAEGPRLVIVSGIWIMFNPIKAEQVSQYTCHEVLGCSYDGVAYNDQDPGPIYGTLFGIGLKW